MFDKRGGYLELRAQCGIKKLKEHCSGEKTSRQVDLMNARARETSTAFAKGYFLLNDH